MVHKSVSKPKAVAGLRTISQRAALSRPSSKRGRPLTCLRSSPFKPPTLYRVTHRKSVVRSIPNVSATWPTAKPRSIASTARTRTSKVEYRPWHMTTKEQHLSAACQGQYVAELLRRAIAYGLPFGTPVTKLGFGLLLNLSLLSCLLGLRKSL